MQGLRCRISGNTIGVRVRELIASIHKADRVMRTVPNRACIPSMCVTDICVTDTCVAEPSRA
jgi:hypothetical protein